MLFSSPLKASQASFSFFLFSRQHWAIYPFFHHSSVAQWKRAGPITQRSMDRNHPLLDFFLSIGGSLSFTSPCFPLQIQNRPCWFKNGTDTTLCHYPLIAQLVERRTVVGIVMQISLGRWFESGSRDYFLKDLLSEIPVFLFREGAKRKAKICPG